MAASAVPANNDYAPLVEPHVEAEVDTRRQNVAKVVALAIVGCGALASLAIVDFRSSSTRSVLLASTDASHTGGTTTTSDSAGDDKFLIYSIYGAIAYLVIGLIVGAIKGPDPKMPDGFVNSSSTTGDDPISQCCAVLNCCCFCVGCCATCNTDEIIQARVIFLLVVLFWPIACVVPMK
eukprot:TRINITY_DN36978_c0_g1_i1.p2 TRINITY_DN36978_c0_g1~~TRINITY_DN36978_c0_g1_i1.p2  ORF type:complete len:179 (+),score=18.47 TRINITY_DN36978_c0_g1_i1:77-613(+)